MKKRPYLSPDEAAWELGVSRRSIYRYIREGWFIAYPIRPGGPIRIPRESLERHIQNMTKQYQVEEGIIIKERVT